jgi:hypothetical protein
MSAFNYTCNLCGRRGDDVMPTSGGDDGFSLYDEPALCKDCAVTWAGSTREFRARVRRWLGVEDEAA